MRQSNKPFFIYLTAISSIGFTIVILALFEIASFQPLLHFLLFVLLTICAQFITSSFPVSKDAGITYQVSPAVSMAVIPFFGPFAAALVDAVAAITLWLIKPADRTNWKRSWSQLAFNSGMGSIAVFAAGWTFIALQNRLGEGLVALVLSWLVAAVVNDQVNLWLLIGVFWLQHQGKMSPVAVWKENVWAMVISISLMSIGGALLAYSLRQFGPIGLLIFFLPIMLSAITFRFYVRQKEAYTQELERVVHERTAELKALNERKDAFLAVLAHDMITPLTTMQLYAELIQEDPETPVKDPQSIEVMVRSQKHLHRLLQNILDLEKLNTGNELPVRKTKFDLISILKPLIEMVQVEASEKGITIEHQLCSEAVTLVADQNQVERILLNLLSNALKYTQVNGSILVTAVSQDSFATVNVTDTGYGISAEELPFIFERFSRVSQLKDKATGAGLGLAITKALVEAHGGRVTAVSELGKGSTFIVHLPLSHAVAAKSVQEHN